MGLDYALVHVKYTIPPAILLTFIYWPFFTGKDWYRLSFLITIAVIYTTPWDSYLIRTAIWSYPSDAVLGPLFFDIPLEEIFFFVIQTYDVSLFYMLISKPTFFPAYLGPQSIETRGFVKSLGYGVSAFLLWAIYTGAELVLEGEEGTYMGLIVIWAAPILLLLWSLSFPCVLCMPASNVLIPIILPTLYLWLVDTWALQRGTWVINNGTKLGANLWDGLDVEEAFFFAMTNTLVVFGQIAFENAAAVIDSFPATFPESTQTPTPWKAVQALLRSSTEDDFARVRGFRDAVDRLKAKSRSFYLASSTFTGRLRIDLILLYSFCRVADDLIDGATEFEESKKWIAHLKCFLDAAYSEGAVAARRYVKDNFPENVHLALLHLPIGDLSPEPLYGLLKGFEWDLRFSDPLEIQNWSNWPIKTEEDLEQYGIYVAGTVAELCLDLVLKHCSDTFSSEERDRFKAAGRNMGVALQTVNIARDIQVDARLHRVYIPTTWLEEEGFDDPEAVIRRPEGTAVGRLRTRLLNTAFARYSKARDTIESLPSNSRGPMRVAIESYMEIGRVLRKEGYQVKTGRATVPSHAA